MEPQAEVKLVQNIYIIYISISTIFEYIERWAKRLFNSESAHKFSMLKNYFRWSHKWVQ